MGHECGRKIVRCEGRDTHSLDALRTEWIDDQAIPQPLCDVLERVLRVVWITCLGVLLSIRRLGKQLEPETSDQKEGKIKAETKTETHFSQSLL